MGNQAYGSLPFLGRALPGPPTFFESVDELNGGIIFNSKPLSGISGSNELPAAPFHRFVVFLEPMNIGAQGVGLDTLSFGQSLQAENLNFKVDHNTVNNIIAGIDTQSIHVVQSQGEPHKNKPQEAVTSQGLKLAYPIHKSNKEPSKIMLSQHAHTGVLSCKVFSPTTANNILSLVDSGSISTPAVVSASLCLHKRLSVLGESIHCGNCMSNIGSVWDEEWTEMAFDGFNEAKEVDSYFPSCGYYGDLWEEPA